MRDFLCVYIKGFDNSNNKELFVRGVNCNGAKVYRDVENAVRDYCVDRNIHPIYQRVIGFRVGKPTAGCKLVLRAEDEKKVYDDDFWPKGISVREWYENPADMVSSSEKESDGDDNV